MDRLRYGLNFDPEGPPDPADPRIVPASMQFTFVTHQDRVYIEWNIAEVMRMDGQNEKRHYPDVIKALISPADARAFAQRLLDAAAKAEDVSHGGAGLTSVHVPPISPPPPLNRSD